MNRLLLGTAVAASLTSGAAHAFENDTPGHRANAAMQILFHRDRCKMKQPAAITQILNKLQKEKGYSDEELSIQRGAMEIFVTQEGLKSLCQSVDETINDPKNWTLQVEATKAPSTFTDDDIRVILGIVGLPYAFQTICTSFKPPLKVSPENMEKYISVRVPSNDPEAAERVERLLKEESVGLAKQWGASLAERHKKDADPFAGMCNEIVQRVGPQGTDAPGLLVELASGAEDPKAVKQEWWRISWSEKSGQEVCLSPKELATKPFIDKSPAEQVEGSIHYWDTHVDYDARIASDDGDEVVVRYPWMDVSFFRTEAACVARIQRDTAEAKKKADEKAAKEAEFSHSLDKYR